MKLISLKLPALALAGLLAASTGAQATSLAGIDQFPEFPNRYEDDGDYEDYCEENRHADVCEDYWEEKREHRRYHRKKAKQKVYNNRCRALIRAVGKRNLVKVFARNSARFAWRRETREVHGNQYATWNNAENARVTCSKTGLLYSCVAKATPCKY